jgi:triosephosphate isomerase
MSSHTQPLVIGNWKMNPVTQREAINLFLAVREKVKNISGVETAICTPFVWLSGIQSARGRSKKPALGAQDIFYEQKGSYTGEISPAMLTDVGVTHVIIGHSERRAVGETSEEVAKKANAALIANMTAIVCVGEEERDEDGAYQKRLKDEIKTSLAGIPKKHLNRLVIAYEPIWAIGGEEAMDPSGIHEMVVFIRRELRALYNETDADRPRIMYGGSVGPKNISGIMSDGAVDGVLPGRASRDPQKFYKLLEAVREHAMSS